MYYLYKLRKAFVWYQKNIIYISTQNSIAFIKFSLPTTANLLKVTCANLPPDDRTVIIAQKTNMWCHSNMTSDQLSLFKTGLSSQQTFGCLTTSKQRHTHRWYKLTGTLRHMTEEMKEETTTTSASKIFKGIWLYKTVPAEVKKAGKWIIIQKNE